MPGRFPLTKSRARRVRSVDVRIAVGAAGGVAERHGSAIGSRGAGGWYHVTARGNNRQGIYLEDGEPPAAQDQCMVAGKPLTWRELNDLSGHPPADDLGWRDD